MNWLNGLEKQMSVHYFCLPKISSFWISGKNIQATHAIFPIFWIFARNRLAA